MMTALAAAATIALASPASAAVVLTSVNGPNLDTHIKASTTNTQNDNTTVYGSTLNSGQSDDVVFTANTAVHITDGAGYASIGDVLTDNTLFTSITSNPVPGFSAYQFSIQLNTDSYLLVEYLLNGAWTAATAGNVANPFFQAANTLRDYQITADAGEVMDAIRVSTCSTSACTAPGGGIFLFKQNSINMATGAVPEPATWAMMLLGFGGIGMTMRRRRKPALAQVA